MTVERRNQRSQQKSVRAMSPEQQKTEQKRQKVLEIKDEERILKDINRQQNIFELPKSPALARKNTVSVRRIKKVRSKKPDDDNVKSDQLIEMYEPSKKEARMTRRSKTLAKLTNQEGTVKLKKISPQINLKNKNNNVADSVEEHF